MEIKIKILLVALVPALLAQWADFEDSWLDQIDFNYDYQPNTTVYPTTAGTHGSIVHLNYTNNEHLIWPIYADCEKIYIYSAFFDVEEGYDFVIIDGIINTGNDSISGVVIGQTTVKFSSDSIVTAEGFILNWECTNENITTTTAATPNTKTPTTARVTLSTAATGSNGSIEYLNYSNDAYAAWRVESDCDQVHIYSEVFDTEADFDYLVINGASYSGSGNISQIVPGNFSLQFSSDNSENASGFILHWTCSNENVTDFIADNRIVTGARCRSGNQFYNPTPQSRIVGGVEAIRNSWPWIVSLQSGGSHFCGGSIINAEWIATAAHCCISHTPNSITVKLGQHDLSESSSLFQTVSALAIHIDPNYNSIENDHDFCLIKTAPFTMQGNVPGREMYPVDVVCLPRAGEHIAPDDGIKRNNCYIAGWGSDENGHSPKKLQSASVNIFSSDFCRENTHFSTHSGDDPFDYYNQNAEFNPDSEFCAGYIEGGRDTCQGDSGGPLVCIVDGEPVLYGITSWGIGCGDPDSPGVYAKVSTRIDWFESVINGSTLETFTTDTPDYTTTLTTSITSEPMTGTSGVIELSQYENNHYQEWIVHADCDQVHVESIYFDTETCCDHLYIGDEKYRGNISISTTVSGAFAVSFNSDSSVTYAGFALQWNCLMPELFSTDYTTDFTTHYTTDFTPDHTTQQPPMITSEPMTGTSGVIELSQYENQHYQTWIVQADCDQVHVESVYFDTEQCCDHLTIENETYSGSISISQMVSGSFALSFSSDKSQTNSGFALQWMCIIPDPPLECESQDFCYRRGLTDGSWGMAKAFCDEHNMVLPLPQDGDENEKYTAIGPTWLDVNVNDLISDWTDISLGAVFNFRCGNDWNRSTDSSFKCVKQNGRAIWTQCHSRRCTRFTRDPFQFSENLHLFRCNE